MLSIMNSRPSSPARVPAGFPTWPTSRRLPAATSIARSSPRPMSPRLAAGYGTSPRNAGCRHCAFTSPRQRRPGRRASCTSTAAAMYSAISTATTGSVGACASTAALRWSRWTTDWRPSTHSPPRWTMPGPPCGGSPRMRKGWASTQGAWPWPATARGRCWPACARCSPVTSPRLDCVRRAWSIRLRPGGTTATFPPVATMRRGRR